MTEKTITITVKEYESLLKDSSFMRALEQAGVDNWEGYDYAIDILNGENQGCPKILKE